MCCPVVIVKWVHAQPEVFFNQILVHILGVFLRRRSQCLWSLVLAASTCRGFIFMSKVQNLGLVEIVVICLCACLRCFRCRCTSRVDERPLWVITTVVERGGLSNPMDEEEFLHLDCLRSTTTPV
jgi:hypothetical protein